MIEHKSDWNEPDGASYAEEAWLREREEDYEESARMQEMNIDDFEITFDFSKDDCTYVASLYDWRHDKAIDGECVLSEDGAVLYSDFPSWINELIQYEFEYRD